MQRLLSDEHTMIQGWQLCNPRISRIVGYQQSVNLVSVVVDIYVPADTVPSPSP